MTTYLDTSAAAKLILDEPESTALAALLDGLDPEELVSSALLETELRRTASRSGAAQCDVSAVLAGVDLVEPTRSLFREAGLLPGRQLRSLDALHLATALRMDADRVIGYDLRMLDAAKSLGLDTLSPA